MPPPPLSHGIVLQSGRDITPRSVMWYTPGTARMERRAAKELWGISTTGGGPQWAARSDRKRDIGWRSRGWRGRRIASARYTPFRPGQNLWCPPAPGRGCVPPLARSDPVRSGPPGPSACTGSGPSHPYAPSEKRPARIVESSPWIAPVPRASATNRGGQGGLGSTMKAQWVKAGGRWSHRGPRGWCLGGTLFCEPRRGERMKVGTLGWRLKSPLTCLLISMYFWFPWLSPLPGFYGMTVLRQRTTKNKCYAWIKPWYGLFKTSVIEIKNIYQQYNLHCFSYKAWDDFFRGFLSKTNKLVKHYWTQLYQKLFHCKYLS